MSAANITLTPLLTTADGYQAIFYQGGAHQIGRIFADANDVRHWQIRIIGGVANQPGIVGLQGSVYPSFSAASEALRKAARRLGEVDITADAKRKLQHPKHLITAELARTSFLDIPPANAPAVPVTPAQLARDVLFEDVLPTAAEQRVYFLCRQIGIIKIDDENDSFFVLDESLYNIFFELDALSDEGEGYWESRAECSEAIRECIAEVDDAQEIFSLIARAKENGIGDE